MEPIFFRYGGEWHVENPLITMDELKQFFYDGGGNLVWVSRQRTKEIISNSLPNDSTIDNVVSMLLHIKDNRDIMVENRFSETSEKLILFYEDELEKKEEWQRTRVPKKKVMIPGYVYVIKDSIGNYKIGRTKNIERRVKKYVTENSGEVFLDAYAKVEDYKGVEKELHDMFSHENIHGEWFNLSDNDMETIREFLKNKEQ